MFTMIEKYDIQETRRKDREGNEDKEKDCSYDRGGKLRSH